MLLSDHFIDVAGTHPGCQWFAFLFGLLVSVFKQVHMVPPFSDQSSTFYFYDKFRKSKGIQNFSKRNVTKSTGKKIAKRE
jgi:hypothetical protein